MYFATDGRWKYLYYAWGGAEQLFDLAEDPGECRDLAAGQDAAANAVLAECRQRLRDAIPRIAPPDGADDAPLHRADAPLPDEVVARATNPFAWRGPIRYGGHW